MFPPPGTDAAPAMPGLPAADPARRRAEEQLAQLFRHFLKEGRIHPLYPLMLRYRGLVNPSGSGHE
jgi:hypothetical protein